MATYVFMGDGHGGEVVHGAHAVVAAADRGVLYGDGVFETLRTCGQEPFALGPHLQRLQQAAAATFITYPGEAAVRAALRSVLRSAHGAPDSPMEWTVRISLTRAPASLSGAHPSDTHPSDTHPSGASFVGPAADPLTATGCRLTVVVSPLVLPTGSVYDDGIATVHVPLNGAGFCAVPGVKSTSYLASIVALGVARRRGAHEALGVDGQGQLLEGATSNVFVVKASRLCTPGPASSPGLPLAGQGDPGLSIRAGVTRELVVALAAGLGLAVTEGRVTLADLYAADEAFVTSSIRGIVPVASIDGRPLGSSHVPGRGPVTRALWERYQALLGPPPRGAAPGARGENGNDGS